MNGVKGQQSRINAGIRDFSQSNFRVKVGAEAGAGWRREGHKAMDSSEPNPPSGAVLGEGKAAVGRRWRCGQAREPAGTV